MNNANSKIFSALSLCMKAGALTRGFDAVAADLRTGKTSLLLFAQDISQGTKRKMLNICPDTCQWRDTPLLQQDIAIITKKPVGVMSVTNQGLAALCLAGLPNEEE